MAHITIYQYDELGFYTGITTQHNENKRGMPFRWTDQTPLEQLDGTWNRFDGKAWILSTDMPPIEKGDDTPAMGELTTAADKWVITADGIDSTEIVYFTENETEYFVIDNEPTLKTRNVGSQVIRHEITASSPGVITVQCRDKSLVIVVEAWKKSS